MGGIDWSGIPFVVEYFGVIDVDEFICRLVAIRDNERLKHGG